VKRLRELPIRELHLRARERRDRNAQTVCAIESRGKLGGEEEAAEHLRDLVRERAQAEVMFSGRSIDDRVRSVGPQRAEARGHILVLVRFKENAGKSLQYPGLQRRGTHPAIALCRHHGGIRDARSPAALCPGDPDELGHPAVPFLKKSHAEVEPLPVAGVAVVQSLVRDDE